MRSAKRKADEKIGNVDCYVLTQNISEGTTKTLWIGKQDFLIHQIENDTSAESFKAALEAAAKKFPETKPAIGGASGDIKSVETHENISINQNFSASDFSP